MGGAAQLTLSAEPIVFRRSMHVAAAGPERMREFGYLLVCDQARRVRRGQIQGCATALTHHSQRFGNRRRTELVMMTG